MGERSLVIATGFYDRVRAIGDGRVSVDGCAIDYRFLSPEQLFERAIRKGEFDVCELSFSYYVGQVAAGDDAFVALPVFLSRVFRHSGIYIRTDRGITEPKELRGRRVGVPEYGMTGAVWQRGLLLHDYGVRPEEIAWCTGGLDRPRAMPLFPFVPPPGLSVSPIPADRSLSDMLAGGEIDALLSSGVPACIRAGATGVARLFPDYRTVEQAYFRRTRLHPIMHVVVLRRRLLDEMPDLPAHLYDAFCRAKDLATAELEELSTLRTMLPWVGAELAATRQLMGNDYWPYGLGANRAAIEAFVSYAHEQRLIARRPAIAQLFPAEHTGR